MMKKLIDYYQCYLIQSKWRKTKMKRTERRDLIKALLIAQITQLIKEADLSVLYQILPILYKTDDNKTTVNSREITKKLLNQSTKPNTSVIKEFFKEVEKSARTKPFI